MRQYSFLNRNDSSYFPLIMLFFRHPAPYSMKLQLNTVRLSARFLLWIPVLFLLSYCGTSDPDREANRLFVEAYRLTERAGELEQEDPVAAYRHYREALDNIEKIIEDYSTTTVAVNATQQQTSIGELTIAELRRKVPLLESRAGALEGFHELTLYLAGRMDDETESAELKIRYAQWAYANEDTTLYHELMEQVRSEADQHWNTEITDPIYSRLAVTYSKHRRWPQALEAANQIQDSELLSRTLENILDNGFIQHAEKSGYEDIIPQLDYVSPTDHINLLERMAVDLFSTGAREEALSLLTSLPPADEDDDMLAHIDALTRLSEAYTSRGEFEASRSIIDEIRELDEDYADFALRDLSIELARRQNMDEALEIAHSFGREYFEHAAIARISVQHAANGMISEALTMLDDIPYDVSEKAESYIDIAYLLSDYGDNERADSLLNAAGPLMENIDSHALRLELALETADIHMLRNERSLAADVLDEAENNVMQISGSQNLNYIIEQIVSRWITLGRPDRVLESAVYFDMEQEEGSRRMQRLMEQASDNGYHELARSLAGMSEKQHHLLFLLNQHYLERNNIDRSIELSYDIRNYHWRSKALSDLAGVLAGISGREVETEKAATDALQTIQRIRDEATKEETLLYVSSRLSASGITMNESLKSLAKELLGQFKI